MDTVRFHFDTVAELNLVKTRLSSLNEIIASTSENIQFSNCYTKAPTYGWQITLPCSFWRTKYPSKVRICIQLSCLHTTRFIVHNTVHPLHLPFQKSRTQAFQSVIYVLLMQQSQSIRDEYPMCQRTYVQYDKIDKIVEERPSQICIARQSLLQPHTECCVMATTSSSDIPAIELRILERPLELTFAAHSMVDVLPSQPFHSHSFKSFAKAMHLPIHVVEAYRKDPPKSVMTFFYSRSTVNPKWKPLRG